MRRVAILLLCLFLFTACYRELSESDMQRIAQKVIVCNQPYLRFETGCCLNTNNNSICDIHEPINAENTTELNNTLLNNTTVSANTTTNITLNASTNTTENTTPNTSVVNTTGYPSGTTPAATGQKSSALRLSFKNKEPPAKVYDSGRSPFNVTVVLENIGTAEIGPETDNPLVFLRLEGILPSIFGKEPWDFDKGAWDRIPSGERREFTYDNLNYWQRLGMSSAFTLRASACYDYQTSASTSVCVHDDLLAAEECPTSMLDVQNAFGPLIVTQAAQYLIDHDQTQAVFTIGNTGEGAFFGRSDEERCMQSPLNHNMYNISIEVMTSNTTAISCPRFANASSGSMVLYGGMPQSLNCFVLREESTNGKTLEPIRVVMRYRYSQFVEQQLTVVS